MGAFLITQVVEMTGQLGRVTCIVVLAEYLEKLVSIVVIGWVWPG